VDGKGFDVHGTGEIAVNGLCGWIL
jgi:hypothetical protein